MASLVSSGSSNRTLIICFGEMLVDLVSTYPDVPLRQAPGFVKAPGGAPANVAVAVARLDRTAAFIGKVGEDEFGHMLNDILALNHVGVDGIRFSPKARTALAFITLHDHGEREFMFYRNPSADMLLEPAELDLGMIRSAKVFHYGSISLIDEPCRSAHLRAMKEAKAAGALLSYDPNLRLPLWPSANDARERIMSIWDKADVIKVSEEELAFLTGNNNIDDANALRLWRPTLRLLVVTLGANGCRYYARDFRGSVHGFRVDAIDTTGAGDSFMGALLTRIVDNPNILADEPGLREALTFANACGALTTTRRGAIPALPTRNQALELIQNNPV